jgi:hypothetical protein
MALERANAQGLTAALGMTLPPFRHGRLRVYLLPAASSLPAPSQSVAAPPPICRTFTLRAAWVAWWPAAPPTPW